MKEIRLGRVLVGNRHKRGITQDELAAYLGGKCKIIRRIVLP